MACMVREIGPFFFYGLQVFVVMRAAGLPVLCSH